MAPDLTVGMQYDRQLQPMGHGAMGPTAMVEQCKQWIQDTTLTTTSGEQVPVHLRSLHLSTETPLVAEVAEALYALIQNPVSLPLTFAGPSGWLMGSDT
jgi:hypothetical protein